MAKTICYIKRTAGGFSVWIPKGDFELADKEYEAQSSESEEPKKEESK